jgi:hypothetical protein
MKMKKDDIYEIISNINFNHSIEKQIRLYDESKKHFSFRDFMYILGSISHSLAVIADCLLMQRIGDVDDEDSNEQSN